MSKFLKNKNNKVIFAWTINLFLVFLAVFIFGPRYATDDDISMAAIAYGIFCEPQSRLVFSCTAFGEILKLLSGLVDGINWQLIIYYTVLLYGGGVSLYYILKRENKISICLWFLVVTSFYHSAYVNVNFSVITSMLAFYGYVTLFVGAHTREKKPIYLSVVILIFAMIIRYESFFAFSFFAVVLFALLFEKDIKSEGMKQAFFRYFIPFAIALCIPMSLVIIDRLSYREEAWSSYLEYNDNRSQILDFQSVLKHEDENYFSELGLSSAMVESLKNWQFNDTEIYNEQLVIKMGNDSKRYNPKLSLDFLFETLGYCVEKICKVYYFALGVLFLALVTIRKDKEQRGGIRIFTAPWIMMVPLLLEMGFYFFMNRGIDRVFRTTGLGFWCGIVVLFCCDYYDYDLRDNLLNGRRFFLSTLIILFVGVVLQVDDLKDIRGFHTVNEEIVDANFSFLNDGRIYMCDIDAVRKIWSAYGVWQVPSRGSLYNCVELGGWLVNYPTIKEKQNAMGIANPYKSLAYNDDVYLLTTQDGKIQLEFLKSAYDKSIESKLVEKHDDLSLYKYGVR